MIADLLQTATNETRDRGHKTQTQTSKGTRLKQAGNIAGLCDKAVTEMSESLSFVGEDARGNAQALAAVARAWQAAVEEMRKTRGEPLPGSRRPAQEQAKRPKARLSSLPPRVAKPVAAVTETVVEPKP